MKIKKFAEFIEESYAVEVDFTNKEYGYAMFDEITESLMSEINNSINEGRIVLDDAETLEEGFFGKMASLFKKGSDAAEEKQSELKSEADALKKYNFAQGMKLSGKEIEKIGAKINRKEIEEDVLKDVDSLLKKCEDICNSLSEKEEEAYKSITKKLAEVNDTIQEFTKSAIETMKQIAEKSRNKVADIISTVMMVISKMGEIAKNALKSIGKGVVLALCVPVLLAYSIYKAGKSLCKTLCEKSKEIWESVKESFASIKTAITEWVVETLKACKDELKKASDAMKEGAKEVYRGIAKAYLTIVAIIGQIVTDTKDAIKDAYDEFVKSASEFKDDVKAYISEKWDAVSAWCEKAKTAFSEGVKNVCDKMGKVVTGAVGAVMDAKDTLEKDAKSTWEDFKSWNSSRQKRDLRAKVEWGIEKWGKDEIQKWIDDAK